MTEGDRTWSETKGCGGGEQEREVDAHGDVKLVCLLPIHRHRWSRGHAPMFHDCMYCRYELVLYLYAWELHDPNQYR